MAGKKLESRIETLDPDFQSLAMRSLCYAISPKKLLTLVEEARFPDVKRLDNGFYQPVLMGTKRS